MTINHLHLKVADIQKSIAFYTSLFGFREKVKFSDKFYFLQDSSGFDLALDEKSEVLPLPPGFHFGFALQNREQVIAALEKFRSAYPELLHGGLNEHGSWGDFNCTDPDGYAIQVYWDVDLH